MEYMSLDIKLALIAVFVQVALTFYAAVTMGIARVRAVRGQAVSMGDIALDSTAYPDETRKYGNNLANQFEFPVLLYVAVILASLYDAASMAFALSCVAYVVTRLHHRLIHVGRNKVALRFQVFLAGLVFLFMAWVFLALGLLGEI